MRTDAPPASRLRSPELLEAVRTGSPEKTTIIVELEASPSRIVLAPSRVESIGRMAMAGVESAGEVDASVVGHVGSEIRRITGIEPRHLKHGGAFVVEASGTQIGEISGVTGVAAIWPNRSIAQGENATST